VPRGEKTALSNPCWSDVTRTDVDVCVANTSSEIAPGTGSKKMTPVTPVKLKSAEKVAADVGVFIAMNAPTVDGRIN